MRESARVFLTYGQSGLANLKEHVLSAHGNTGLGETNTAYVTRADCGLDELGEERKERVLRQYDALCKIVKASGVEPISPVNFVKPDMNEVEANKANHTLLRQARFVVPLTAEMSTGRGWDMGFGYGILIPTVPFVRDGEKVNVATTILPKQIPVRYKDLTDPEEAKKWVEFFKDLQSYSFGVGVCDEHGETLAGRIGKDVNVRDECMRCVFADEMADLGKMIGKW